MSEQRTKPERHDAGMSLVEVLVATLLTGLLVASLSAAVVAVLRQHHNSGGRFLNASSEQMANTWLSSDLSSAQSVSVEPAAMPCTLPCPAGASTGGSNVLLLGWSSIDSTGGMPINVDTTVSYRYLLMSDQYVLQRVRCIKRGSGALKCATSTVLPSVPGPPSGEAFIPGTTTPTWAVEVFMPPAPVNTDSALVNPNGQMSNTARRVVVTVNGGGSGAGMGGGWTRFSISAGGTRLAVLDTGGLQGVPTFSAPPSRCGGNFGLVIDRSGSIGWDNMQQVVAGATQLVKTFAGTPVKIQAVSFAGSGRQIGGGHSPKYFNMLDPTQVNDLLSQIQGLYSYGSTNWEDAMFRLFMDPDTGAVQPQIPDTVLFFTDGIPNVSRLGFRADDELAPVPPPLTDSFPSDSWWLGWTSSVEDAWSRTNTLINPFRGTSTRFIGVGVGAEIGGTTAWRTLGKGYHEHYQRGFHYAQFIGGWWQRVDKAAYDAAPADERKKDYQAPYEFWEDSTYDDWMRTASDGRTYERVYTPPYDAYEWTSSTVDNSWVLQSLITGKEAPVPGNLVNGAYTNAAQANVYILPDWSGFAKALQAVALAQCGGTLTLQTKEGSTPVDDTFTYQNSAVTDAAGASVDTTLKTVTTSSQYGSGTFDFTVGDGSYVTVDVVPQDLANLAGYQQGGWTCTARGESKAFSTIPIAGSTWVGVRVQVKANEAVSCVNKVSAL